MKSIKIAFIVFFGIVNVLFSQWQGDTRLTNNPANSLTSYYNNGWSIATAGNFVHVVWHDSRDGNPEIYYKRSTDGGTSWQADTRLTNNGFDSYDACVAVLGSAVHVVWYDGRDGNYEIYYKRSTDGGASWGPDTRITNNTYLSLLPSVAVTASAVHIVWNDQPASNNDEIYYKRSTDGGASWSAETRLTNFISPSHTPTIAAEGSNIHISWTDSREVFPEVYYKRSTDSGITWGNDIPITEADFINSEFSSISVSGSTVHIVWVDSKNSNTEIYYRRSTNSGVSWEAETRLTNNSAVSVFPSLAVSGSAAHIVWNDMRDGNHEIYYKNSTDGGVTWGTDIRLTNNPEISQNSFIAVSGSVLHVVWRDSRDGNFEIYYKRDPTGNPNAINIISGEVPDGFSLSQNYPNPFNPITNIEFSVPKTGIVKLTVFDILGREIALLVNENLNTGTYKADFDASNLPNGVYFYKMQTENFTDVKKMILIK